MAGAGTLTPVKSAQRVLDIFEFYAERGSPATLSEIASLLQMPKSSCLALLSTLSARGYLYEMRAQVGYYPTRRWFDKAEVITARDPLIAMARPILSRLRDELGETLIFAKLSGRQIVYLDVAESREVLRYTAVAGQTKPLHGTASGKAALGALPEPARRTMMAQLDFDRLTPRTLQNAETLEQEIRHGQARGFHVSLGENVPDAAAVAVAISLNQEICVLTAAGLTRRLEHRLDEIGELLRRAAAQIGKP
ncbi:MAG: IclR family transcriptional regulator [Phreatobacter sp.]|uniref:IclR family transcriptional regulator n=1 Tax=Phreatobacter sp. TaxID=1966341 RepID=UPI001A539394|nr:IclR family transcriptional regulator [Phreatobacter sp.]MBL8569557.1 IclR family transcriptional regulator [Phreatobacter sp.]